MIGQKQAAETALDQFLEGLSELSRKHGIGIGGDAWPYAMEPDDFRNVYICDEGGRLAIKEV
jgi:hypothetical protein